MELHTSEKDKIHNSKKHHLLPKSFWWDILFVFAGVAILLLVFGSQYATGEFGLSASVRNAGEIEPKDSVNIIFNEPVVPSVIETKFKISPQADVNFIWSQNYQNLEIKPVKAFSSGENYQIEIDPYSFFSVSRIIKKDKDPIRLSFSIKNLPKVASIVPASGSPAVKIDSGIEVAFDRSTRGYDVNFEVVPSCDCELAFDNQREVFTLTPKNKLKWATDYVISVNEAVSGTTDNEKKLPEVFRANFKTESEPPPPPPPAEKKVAQEVTVAEPIEAKIKEGKYIDINLAKQNLSIFEDGKRLGTYRVSSGKRGMATPTGTFKVLSKSGRAYSKKYNLYMPFWMQFTGAGHGIHELPEWKSGYKEGANHLGTPVSHGCVRLGVGPAAKVYSWSSIGTPVVIHY